MERTKAIVIIAIIGIASVGGLLLLLPRALLEQHDPIVIESNEDFETQGWSGSGTVDDPYLISGLSIVSSDICVNIGSTTAHFTLQDCYISSTSNLYAVRIWNIANGDFINNEIADSGGHGMFLSSCDDVIVTSNTIRNNGLNGIYMSDSVNCEISYNNINNNDGSGVSLTFASDCQISSNTIRNNGEWGLLFANSDGNTESNNSYQGNSLGEVGYQNC